MHPASVVGIAATVPQVLLLFRSLKYSSQGIEAFGVPAGEAEAEVALDGAAEETVDVKRGDEADLRDPCCCCLRRWSRPLDMLEKCMDSPEERVGALAAIRRHSMPG
jgi:hypothetical protein